MNNKPKLCPRCNQIYAAYPSLSRRDNSTYICPECGEEEAYIDAKLLAPTKNEIEFVDLLNKYPRIFVNVYTKTSKYGGPEEGGWWYDWYEHEISITASTKEDALDFKDMIEKEIKNHTFKYGGNCVIIEGEYADSESKEIPHYE